MDMSHAGERSVAKTDAVVVEVTDLVAGYLPGVNILNSTNLIARQGELIGIIGPNGAGKSTLLKAIFGLVKVRGGEITVNGESIVGLKADKLVKRGVGVRAAEQQRVPLALDRGEPADGALPEPQDLQRAARVRHRASSPSWASASSSARARSRAASARWWRCRARS